MIQKTWVDLLGDDPTDTTVCGLDIVKRLDTNQFTVLWKFETTEIAWNNFHAWIKECNSEIANDS